MSVGASGSFGARHTHVSWWYLWGSVAGRGTFDPPPPAGGYVVVVTGCAACLRAWLLVWCFRSPARRRFLIYHAVTLNSDLTAEMTVL